MVGSRGQATRSATGTHHFLGVRRRSLPRLAWPGPPGLSVTSYAPTAAIVAQVRAAQPRCVSYDCARVSRRCDLDHVQEWPRGPTSAGSMVPRCRRHHEHKTRRIVQTVLHPDGSVDTTMLTGLTVRTRPEPLPGYGPGEGYG